MTRPARALRPWRAATLAAGLLLLAPRPAPAWLQATTEEEPHLPLHVRESSCLQYTVLRSCSEDVPFEACKAAIDAAMATWTDVDGSFFRFEPTVEASCCRAGFQREGPNANCISWRESDWPPEYPPNGIALTTLTYGVADGSILDADVEFNGVEFTYGTECAAGVTDIRNTLTHEAGHMFGLDHSAVLGATMRPHSFPGDCELRDLEIDDVQGICAIYPSESDPNRCVSPPNGLNLDCSGPPDDCGCRAPGAARPRGLLLLAVAAVLARRRRRPGA